MYKRQVKRDETARFVRARQDPEFSRLVRVRDLGPEHEENQQRLRRATHCVRERMQELEEQLMLLKKRMGDSKEGRQPLTPPSLDSILRASGNITTLATARLGELDRMTAELAVLCPDTVSNVRESSQAPKSQPLHDIVTLHDALPTDNNADISESIADRETLHDIHGALLSARKAPLLTKAAGEPTVIRRRAPVQTPAPAPEPVRVPEPPRAPEPSTPRSSSFFATATPNGKFEPQPRSATPARGENQSLTFEGLVPPKPVENRRLTLEDLGEDSDDASDATYDEDYDDPEYESDEADD